MRWLLALVALVALVAGRGARRDAARGHGQARSRETHRVVVERPRVAVARVR